MTDESPTPKQIAAVEWLRTLLDVNNNHHAHAQALLGVLPPHLTKEAVSAPPARWNFSHEEWLEFRYLPGSGGVSHRIWLERKFERDLADVRERVNEAEREAEEARRLLANAWDAGVAFGWHSTELRTDENPYREARS